MKTATDPRHKTRVSRVQSLFAYSFGSQENYDNIREIITVLDRLDTEISRAAPEWPLAKMNKLDLAVLRLATYELSCTDTPHKVIIDEAVEIAKTYGSETSGGFVNGVLGTILERKSTSHV